MVVITRPDDTAFLDLVPVPAGADMEMMATFAWVKFDGMKAIDYQGKPVENPMMKSRAL